MRAGHWLRLYQGAGTQLVDGVTFVDTVEAGRTVAIWMEPEPLQVREEPDVAARLAEQGKLWLRCYSTICPDGECGYVAVENPDDLSTLAITRSAFEAARARGWTLPEGGLAETDLALGELLRLQAAAAGPAHHPAMRPDADCQQVTYADLRAGDYITAEAEMGERARWVKVTGVSLHGDGMLTVGIETPTGEGPGGRTRWVIDRRIDETVGVDATARGDTDG